MQQYGRPLHRPASTHRSILFAKCPMWIFCELKLKWLYRTIVQLCKEILKYSIIHNKSQSQRFKMIFHMLKLSMLEWTRVNDNFSVTLKKFYLSKFLFVIGTKKKYLQFTSNKMNTHASRKKMVAFMLVALVVLIFFCFGSMCKLNNKLYPFIFI